MTQYYAEVGVHQINLNNDEQNTLAKQLAKCRKELYDTIYSIKISHIIIPILVRRQKSVAKITNEFNSKQRGNNRTIRNKVLNYLSLTDQCKKPKEKIPLLHKCNFRESWLINDVLPLLRKTISKEEHEELDSKLASLKKVEDTLIQSALKAAVTLAINNKGYLSISDAIQEANIGLINAVKKYNPNEGTKFITYAYSRIKYHMLHQQVNDSTSMVRIPKHVKDKLREEGGGGTGWFSLDSNAEFGRSRNLNDLFPDEEPSIEEQVDKLKVKNYIKTCIKEKLSDTEAEIIILRYLSSHKQLTYQQVGDMLDKPVCRERVRQIELKALKELSKCKELKDSLEVFNV